MWDPLPPVGFSGPFPSSCFSVVWCGVSGSSGRKGGVGVRERARADEEERRRWRGVAASLEALINRRRPRRRRCSCCWAAPRALEPWRRATLGASAPWAASDDASGVRAGIGADTRPAAAAPLAAATAHVAILALAASAGGGDRPAAPPARKRSSRSTASERLGPRGARLRSDAWARRPSPLASSRTVGSRAPGRTRADGGER